MKITNEIKPLEIDGHETTVGDDSKLIVESHWNYTDRVHLKWGGLDLLVAADQLERAIANARNHRR